MTLLSRGWLYRTAKCCFEAMVECLYAALGLKQLWKSHVRLVSSIAKNDDSNSVGLVKVEELLAIGFATGYEYTKGILVN